MPDPKVSTAFERLQQIYAKGTEPYQIGDHYYYSKGAFPFTIAGSYVDSQGFTRYFAYVPRGTKIDFFSYGLQDEVSGVGLPPSPFAATDAETNLAERYQTNNEDFAIEGICLTIDGVRMAYGTPGATNPLLALGVSPTATAITPIANIVQFGNGTLNDPASTLVPPEAGSPLVLENAMMQVLRGKVSFQSVFDRKAGDHLCRMSHVGEGGPNSYLRAHGVPAKASYFPIPVGYAWRKGNSDRDKLFSLLAVCQQDAWCVLTLPPLNNGSGTAANNLGPLTGLWVEMTATVTGRAFYVPSQNI